MVNALSQKPEGTLVAAGRMERGERFVNWFTWPEVARWTDQNWESLTTRETGFGLNGFVNGLDVDEAGILYAGGSFTSTGTKALARVARWDGASWHVMKERSAS